MDKYNELRNKYDTFIYDSYEIEELENTTKIIYNFIVPSLTQYKPTLEVKKFKIDSFTKNLIFQMFKLIIPVFIQFPTQNKEL